MSEFEYQGRVPEHPYDYEDFSTPGYLTGHANKIIHDLEKVARLYSGKKVEVYRPTGEQRCPDCTDTLTGERVFSNCSTCNGSGRLNGYTSLGQKWCYLDINAEYNIESEIGSTDNPGGQRHQLIFLGSPFLKYGDLFVTPETKHVYKIVNPGTQIGGLAGTIITQAVQITRITPGQVEYNLLKEQIDHNFTETQINITDDEFTVTPEGP